MAPYPERRAGALTGFFCVDVRTKAGARFRDRFPTLKEAEGFEAYVRATGELPPWAHKLAEAGATFAQAAEACITNGGPKGKWKRGRDASVLQRLDYIVKRWGPVALTDVTTETFDEIAESLEDRPGRSGTEPLTGDTINRYLTAASAVMTFASARPKLFPGVVHPEVPYRPRGPAKIAWYTPEQEDAVCRVLAEAGKPAFATCVRVLAATGLRVSELLALEPGDVENEWVRLWRTKTDRPRSVPIDPPLARELRALIVAGLIPKYQTLYKWVKDAVGKCGYSAELNIHALRHTTATRLIQRGVNPAVVQRFLGHSNIATTMRYVHIQDVDLLAAAEKLLPTARANDGQAENIERVADFPRSANRSAKSALSG